jgi:acyl-homoserine lactone synthase
MRLLVIDGRDIARHASLMDEAFRLRHRVFVEELGWERLRKTDGREIDQFDVETARHFLILDEEDSLRVYTRLLPTEFPHLLSDAYPHLAPRGIPRGPQIWEWTRLAIDPKYRGDGSWSRGSGEMARAVVEHCLANGIEQMTWEGHPVWVTRFLEMGFWPTPLGPITDIDGGPVVAGVMDVTPDILDGFTGRGIASTPMHAVMA